MKTTTIQRLPRSPRRRWSSAALLALATLAPAGVQAQEDGWLLAGIRRTIPNPHTAELIDLRSGARRALPLSSSSLSQQIDVDIWAASLSLIHI